MKTNIQRYIFQKVSRMVHYPSIRVLFLFLAVFCYSNNIRASEIYIGTGEADITPRLPVALAGQMHLRIAQAAETPLTANVVALESQDGGRSVDAAILVSCDVVVIPEILIQMIRDAVQKKLPELDVNKIILNATHTHTAPVLENDDDFWFRYQIPKEGVLQVEEYRAFFVQRVTEAILSAWRNRQPGSVTWGLSHAVVGYHRRPVYDDGTAQMYGNTNTPRFMNIESMEDHDVNVLFFWDARDKLIATAIGLSCPAQEVENRYAVNADYWHPVREELKHRFGEDLCVLGWTSAAGDISTRPMYRRAAEERMVRLRNLTQLEEMGRRVVLAVEEAYETVREERSANVPLIHQVERMALPMRLVTEQEYLYCKSEMEKAAAQIAADPEAAEYLLPTINWNRSAVDRYERQLTDPTPEYETEVHVIRLGDVAICTNEFELYTDFGIRMQARSHALQTFTIQLAGPGTYLATQNASDHGGYGAIIQSCVVGPEGGQILVDRTVELINEMFSEKEK